MTVREFMLKKYPTNKWMDCPISKEIWGVVQEYADEFHKAEVKKLNIPDVSDCQFESYAAFCIECDRQGLNPIKYRDYLEIG